MPLKTAEQVKEEFELNGQSISQWAIENGFSAALVYRVLNSEQLPKRGRSHDIAVMLGLKQGFVSEPDPIRASG